LDFQKFDERELALLFQEQTAGGAQSNFNKLISRETAEESGSRSRSKGSTTTHRKRTPKKTAAKKSDGGTEKDSQVYTLAEPCVGMSDRWSPPGTSLASETGALDTFVKMEADSAS